LWALHFPSQNTGYFLDGQTNALKCQSNTNCFAYYSVDYDSTTSIFTIYIDSTTSAQAVSYLWDFGDGTTSILQTPTHIVSIDTAYMVCMKIYTATGDSCKYCHLLGKDHFSNIIRDQGYTINIENPNNIATNIQSNEIKKINILVYPNPTNGVFNVLLNKQLSNAICNIYDITGKLILTKTITSANFQIDLSNENGAMYILEIIGKDNVSRIKLGKK
jgi:hypothetical protein